MSRRALPVVETDQVAAPLFVQRRQGGTPVTTRVALGVVDGAYHMPLRVGDAADRAWVVGRLLPVPLDRLLMFRGLHSFQSGWRLEKIELGAEKRGPASRSRSRDARVYRWWFDGVLVKVSATVPSRALKLPSLKIGPWIVPWPFPIAVALGEVTTSAPVGYRRRRGVFDSLDESVRWDIPPWRHVLLVNMASTLASNLANRVIAMVWSVIK